MARTFTPLGDRILVKPAEREEQTKSGIFLPDTAQEKPQEGTIIEVGPGRVTDEGKHIPMDLKKGDLVLYAKYGGTEIKEEGEEYLLLTERDILAKVS
ncbi:MAG: co-chaperone GroES [Chloroflexota bacterium]|uniref:10 kDa chaperonin n=1 Tax=marine metagenome TaxID=408172 RepID=A0A382GEB9_9ZZZZ|nr:co-chaperone GroES [Chloroflexota bacterium]MEE2656188.1 co-chaperone GroES [Chloroflexota bacterium]